MTAKYVDDPDVQRLVSTYQTMIPNVTGWSEGAKQQAINNLKPFLPDPEEELIKKMVDAYVREPSSFSVKINMVKVLDAIKEAGWRAPDHD